MKPNNRALLLSSVIAAGLALVMSGCAGSQGFWQPDMWTPGFFTGFFHGLFTPVLFLPWVAAKFLALILYHLMGWHAGPAQWFNDFQLYSSVHDDGYGWGYLIGIGLFFLAAAIDGIGNRS